MQQKSLQLTAKAETDEDGMGENNVKHPLSGPQVFIR